MFLIISYTWLSVAWKFPWTCFWQECFIIMLYNILNTCITVTWKLPYNPFCRRIKEYYMDNSMYPFWSEMFQCCFYTWMSITWKFPWISLARRLKYYMDISMYPFWLRMFDTVLSTWVSIACIWKISRTVFKLFF